MNLYSSHFIRRSLCFVCGGLMLAALSAYSQNFGILVKNGISLSGNVLIDSFDSSDPLYSTNGQYIVSKRKAGGNIATVETNVIAAIDTIGPSDVYGKAYVATGSTIVTSGTSAIGDIPWINGGNIGIEPGWAVSNLSLTIPDAPTASTWTVGTIKTMPSITHNSTTNTLLSSGPGTTNIYTTAGAVNINNITAFRITNAPGTSPGGTVVLNALDLSTANSGVVTISPGITFVLNTTGTTGLSLAGSQYITNMAGSKFVLNAPGGMSIGSGTYIGLASNATFTAYLGGTTTTDGAGIPGNKIATNITLYGSITCTNITISGGGALMGRIDAPYAKLAFTGGATFTGSVIGNSIIVQNGFTFHFDESSSPSPPVINVQPQDRTVFVGQSAAFTISVSGYPLNYQWTFNGTNISGATDSSLTLTNVQLDQAGNYAVQVMNSLGSVISSNAVLAVVAQPPIILTQPTNTTIFLNSNATLNVTAGGSLPLNFQWSFNGTNINDATNSFLSFFNAQTNQSGIYSVLVTNLFGSILSSNAVLMVNGQPPVILAQPQNQATLVGSNATFYVSIGGSAPMSYQWSFNGINIVGATNSSLTVTNVQNEQIGAYAVAATNAFGFTNSASATLTFLSSCVSPPSGLIGWWQAESNALDCIGGNNGTLQGTAGFTTGKVGQAFSVGTSSYVSVPDNNLWAFGTNDFSIELWANFNSLPSSTVGGPNGGVFISDDEGAGSVNKWWFAYGGGKLTFHMNSPTLGPIFLVQAPFTPVIGNWYHFSVVRNNNLYSIYANGAVIGSQSTNVVIPNPNAPLTIGKGEAFYFNGLLDEVSIYNRALSASEIEAIYNAEYFGKCFVASPPFIFAQPTNQITMAGNTANFMVGADSEALLWYQWFFNRTNSIVGATNLFLNLNNVQLPNGGNYSVVVTNLYGSTTSSPAVLFVYTNIAQLTPQLTSTASATNGQFQFNISGVSGLNYAIQTSTNLVDWISVSTNASPFIFTDTNINSFPQQFYRAIYSP